MIKPLDMALMVLKLLVIISILPNVIMFSIVSLNTNDHLFKQSVSNFGIPHLMADDVTSIINGGIEDDLFVLHDGRGIALLNSNQVALEKGKIVSAGSKECRSSCDMYTDKHLIGKFPYLDSSIILGHKSDMLRLLPLDDMTKLQTFLSEQYLVGNEDIVVDVSGDIVSTISKDNYKSVELEFSDTNNTLLLSGIRPNIVQLDVNAPLPAKRLFNEIGRYVGNGITRSKCNYCNVDQQSTPTVFIAVYIEEHYPFLSNLLKSLHDIEYDKSKIELVILSLADNDLVNEWVPENFLKFTHLQEEFDSEDHDTKHYFLEMYTKTTADYFVYIDSSVHITKETIPELLSYQKSIIAPLLTARDGTAWANFWGTFSDTWGYKRSTDYDNIFTRTIKGVIPVSCVRNMYVVERSLAVKMVEWNVYENHLEPDISFCKTLFEENVPVFLSNVHEYGWLKNKADDSDLMLTGAYKGDWMAKYVNKEVLGVEAFNESCKNLFHHKSVFSEEFGRDMIKALDHMPGYTTRVFHHDRPGFNVSKTVYNDTLTSIIMELTEQVIPKLYNGYKPQRELYDSWIIEVEGKFEQKRHVNRGNPAAYHVLVPLNDCPASEGSLTGFFFTKQNCYLTDLKSGDLVIFPGFITHQKVDIGPSSGMHLYLELSFDPAH